MVVGAVSWAVVGSYGGGDMTGKVSSARTAAVPTMAATAKSSSANFIVTAGQVGNECEVCPKRRA